jgi:Leucine-rich repeat (LRR) protein
LKAVSKEKFKILSKLRRIAIDFNQIEKIEENTFEGLLFLEILLMDHNKIKYINGQIFLPLKKLTNLDLAENICINKNFKENSEIATIQIL